MKPSLKLVSTWTGQSGVDLCLEWSGTAHKRRLAHFASTGVRTNGQIY